MTSLSFEFFPPRDPAAHEQLRDTVRALSPLNPAFFTVTFGAGGASREGTRNTILDLQRLTDTPIGAHLAFYGIPRDDILAYADDLWNSGVRDIIALRGDAPKDGPAIDPTNPLYFQKTPEFVSALKARHDFTISVGAYPEKHPASPSKAADLQTLKEKLDAGADRAITQFFFENDVFYRFVDDARAAGITAPLVPGVLPIHDFGKVCSFAGRCGANIPQSLTTQFSALQHDPQHQKRFAIDYFAAQMDDLVRHGVPHIHVYALNRADLILAALGEREVLSPTGA